jgi:NADH-quinone oxidoreductase subunit N
VHLRSLRYSRRKNDRRCDFEDYNGIGFRAPLLSFTLSLFMLSLLGLPLTAGFMGKVLVFRPGRSQPARHF